MKVKYYDFQSDQCNFLDEKDEKYRDYSTKILGMLP